MKNRPVPESLEDERAAFLVWSPPGRGARSRVLAAELGIEQLHFIYLWHTRSLLTLPLRYLYRSLRTAFVLGRHRPGLVFIQSPPHLGVALTLLYCILTGGRYVVDAHGAAFQSPYWTRPLWLVRLLARKALVTLVTNERDGDRIKSWGGQAMVVPDIPWDFQVRRDPTRSTDRFAVVVISSHSPDEPLENVIRAARGLPEVDFHITGRPGRRSSAPLGELPHNVRFTGFLQEKDFHALLSSADTIMCLTTRAQTMQRGACEGLWMGKPLIVSDSQLLREYFREGTAWVDNSPADIQRAVSEIRNRYACYAAGIGRLQKERRADWRQRRRRLIRWVLTGKPPGSNLIT